MKAKDVIRATIDSCHGITTAYLSDLNDAELLVRPVAGANHIAWQLGHLIASERDMISGLGHAMPELPAGFEAAHAVEAATRDSGFSTKSEYIGLMERMRAATFAALDATPDSDFAKPGPERMRAYAPTVAAVFGIIGTHELMHAGQFAVVRRKLGKPIVI